MDTIVYDAVQDVKALAEYNGGGIDTLLNGRVVKSVQRGHVVGKVGDEHEINVPISTIEIDKSNIFSGHNRLSIVENIINANIKVNLPNVFYQFSPTERMIVLKAIKDKRIVIDINELYPKLTPGEQLFLTKEY